MKVAVLSMDIEDWYHLDYFKDMKCDRSRSMLDGIDVYLETLDKYKTPSSFFVLGEMVESLSDVLSDIVARGHEVATHGWDHTRPLTMELEEFSEALKKSKYTMEDAIGKPVEGYRAPCFSLDRERLECVREMGFHYDSSKMPFDDHPLYGALKIDDLETLSPNIYRIGDFFEFQLSTLPVAGRNIPVSGGGYIRMFPWFFTKRLIKSYLKQNELYLCYIHPFELSRKPNPPFPGEMGLSSRIRFGLGRSSVAGKLSKLITILKANGFRFSTFSALRRELIESNLGAPDNA